MTKKPLKDAISIKPKDQFVRQGAGEDTSPKKQSNKSPNVQTIKVSFYWEPETEQGLEQLRLAFLTKHRRKLTRSEVVEQLVKIALRNEKILDMLE